MAKDDNPVEAAKNAAFRLIALRARSVEELRGRLRRKGYSGTVIETVIDRLVDLGLLDDESTARQWARTYAVNYLWGDRKIAGRLREMGICDDLVKKVLEETREEFPEIRGIEKILEKRFPERLTAPSNSVKEERRIVRHLAAKGFSAQAVYGVLADTFKEDHDFDGQ